MLSLFHLKNPALARLASCAAVAFPAASGAADRLPSTAGDIMLITTQQKTSPHYVFLLQAGNCEMLSLINASFNYFLFILISW